MFWEDPLKVPVHCGLVQHTVTTLLGAGWAWRASAAAAARFRAIVSEDGVVCLPAELSDLHRHPQLHTPQPLLPRVGGCGGPWMDGGIHGWLGKADGERAFAQQLLFQAFFLNSSRRWW